ncbi:MAG: thiamine pyrophosphate-dependent dehydrogenase E1 component subunit alpha [Candidatus Bathyarchaeota archaeon]|nr:thiamine pyrophosphate-dependent dehydrogenase E1 component subunit alpha [Candidatus Bathyarchaeota archaeon]
MKLGDDKRLDLYRVMVRIRTFENGVRQLINDGKVGYVSFYTGGEAVAAAVSAHLVKEDQIGSTHRPLGHLIAKGADLKRMMAEIAGKATGTNKGKGGAYHIFDKEVGALGANGIVGGSVPMAAGYALANQLKDTDNVSISYFGEGASNQGGVQETLNLAACWKLPMVFVCENSSPEEQTMLGHKIDYPQLSITDISQRAPAYGMPGESHPGWDVEEVYKIAGEAIQRARRGEGPTLLEFKIHRLNADEDSPHCPIKCYRDKLMMDGVLSKELDDKIRSEEAAKVKEAMDFAVGSPEPELVDAYSDIFVEGA